MRRSSRRVSGRIRLFSAVQAATQALQPMQESRSITMPQAFLDDGHGGYRLGGVSGFGSVGCRALTSRTKSKPSMRWCNCVTANVSGTDLGSASRAVEARLARLSLDPAVRVVQGGQQHVPGDPGRGVDPQVGHGRRHGRGAAICAAKCPAP